MAFVSRRFPEKAGIFFFFFFFKAMVTKYRDLGGIFSTRQGCSGDEE